MTRELRLVAALVVLALVTIGGALGYMIVEGAGFSDAIYMTILTISTVGFQEVIPLSGAGRVLTSGIIILGVGAALYTGATAVEIGLEKVIARDARRRRRMSRDIDQLSDHIILCGFGRVGESTWEALQHENAEVAVIELDPEAAEKGIERGALVVEGDATRNETLVEAGIDRARALIACVRNDSDNLVIVLSAKSQRSSLPVIARATEVEAEEKLRLAGADRVVSPQLVGSHRLAALAMESDLDEFVDVILRGRLLELRIEGVHIPADSPMVGRTLRDSGIREHSGAQILAIEAPGGEVVVNPGAATPIPQDHFLIAIGTEEQLASLKSYTTAT